MPDHTMPGLATIRVRGRQLLAVWAGGLVLPLAEAARRCRFDGVVPDSARAALADWSRWRDIMRQVASENVEDGWMKEAEVDFVAPLPDPQTIYCAAANYHDHAEEMRSTSGGVTPSEPMHFLTPPATLTGHRQDVVRPADCERFDWEVELAAIIGATGEIAGYAVANDLSLRDFARRADYPFFPDWLRLKSSAGSLPIGPAIVPADFVPDPMNLNLSLSVNGEQRQASTTKNMIFSVTEQIEYLSRMVPLRTGDIIITGTPAGTGNAWGTYLSPGDVVVAEVDGLGRLENRIVGQGAR